jgi:protein-S-isoprenylcysteine O-methyltransferase Ste14
MSRWAAGLLTALFIPIAGLGVVLLPYAITRWHASAPYPVMARIVGVFFIATGGLLFIGTCVRFPGEGIGTPFPTEPSSRHLIGGGLYRYVRNPLYLTATIAIVGQALLLSRPVLFIYAAGFLHHRPSLR